MAALFQDLGIDLKVALTFFLLWIVIVPTPGANSLLVIHTALSAGAREVTAAIAGNLAGFVLLSGAALLGWNAVIEAFPVLKTVLQVLGAVYLIYFGWRLMASNSPAATAPDGGVPARRSLRRYGYLGLLTALSNAQAILFITSIFAVAGVLNANLATGIACVAILLLSNAVYLAALAAIMSLPAARRGYMRYQHIMRRAFGGIFAVFGARLLVREFAS